MSSRWSWPGVFLRKLMHARMGPLPAPWLLKQIVAETGFDT
jgi:hypothetical protein